MRFRQFFEAGIFNPDHSPIDGEWDPPLKTNSRVYHFYYPVSMDKRKNCFWNRYEPKSGGKLDNNIVTYCNAVKFSLSPQNELYLSFMTSDGSKSQMHDMGGTIASASERLSIVGNSIVKFLQHKHPFVIEWAGIQKTSQKEGDNNPYSRNKIYFLMAAKHLFPDYVPVDENKWIEINHFPKYFQHIILKDPTILESKTAKEFLLRSKSIFDNKSNEKEIYGNELNPQQIRPGDMVEILSGIHKNRVGTATKLILNNKIITVQVRLSNETITVSIEDLHKI